MGKRMLKAIGRASLLLGAMFVATSCNLFGGGGEDETTEESVPASIDSDVEATIKVWYPAGSEYNSALTTAIAGFNELYPNVTVNVVKKAGLDVYQSYLIALNDNNSRPDLAIIDHVYVQNLAFENLVANITTLSGDDGYADNFPSSLYNANCYNGSAYAMPLSANTVTLMCNMDILEAAGITEMPTTFDELLADCELIKQNTNYTPFAQPINDSFCAMEFASYVARRGGSMVSDDCRTVKLDSDEVKQSVNDWVSLSKYASQNEYEEGKFYGGSIAFIEMGSWNLAKITEGSQSFELGVTQMVTMNDGVSNYSGLGLYSMVIAQQSTNKRVAYEFGKYLSTNKEFQLAFAEVDDLFPVTTEALGDSRYTEDEYLSVFAKQMENVAPRPGTPIWPTMEQQIVNMLYGAVTATNQEGIDSAISSAQTRCQSATDTKFGS